MGRQGEGKGPKGLQKGGHPLQLQGRAEKAGEQLPLGYGRGQLLLGGGAPLYGGFQQLFTAQGQLLPAARVGQVHTAVAEAAAQLFEATCPVGAGQVHFVDEQEHGHVVAF